MKRPCLRTLDRPIVALWGLEPIDLGAVLGLVAVLLVATNVGAALVAGLLACLGLKALKAGKPRGYVFLLLYRVGLVRFFPAALRPAYLVLPPSFGRRSIWFSAVPGPEDDDLPAAKFFRGSYGFLR